MSNIEISGNVGLQTRDFSRKWELVGAHFLRLWCKEKMIVTVIALDPSGNKAEDLRRDRVLE